MTFYMYIVCKTGKPVVLSTGMADMDWIRLDSFFMHIFFARMIQIDKCENKNIKECNSFSLISTIF